MTIGDYGRFIRGMDAAVISRDGSLLWLDLQTMEFTNMGVGTYGVPSPTGRHVAVFEHSEDVWRIHSVVEKRISECEYVASGARNVEFSNDDVAAIVFSNRIEGIAFSGETPRPMFTHQIDRSRPVTSVAGRAEGFLLLSHTSRDDGTSWIRVQVLSSDGTLMPVLGSENLELTVFGRQPKR